MLIKAIEFKAFNQDKLYSFLEKHSKTQVVNQECVFGEKHVIHSIQQTLKAFRDHSNLSKKQELEFLVRLCGERQIKKALGKCKPTKKAVFACWSSNSVDIYKEFKQSFDTIESEIKQKKELKKALERTATFWLE